MSIVDPASTGARALGTFEVAAKVRAVTTAAAPRTMALGQVGFHTGTLGGNTIAIAASRGRIGRAAPQALCGAWS
jgi:hypothetical protein